MDVLECSPLNPAEEERLRKKCWSEAAGGRYKGWVYKIGHIDRYDKTIESLMQQTQECSSYEEIDRWDKWLATSEDRLSTTEEQIRHMNSKF